MDATAAHAAVTQMTGRPWAESMWIASAVPSFTPQDYTPQVRHTHILRDAAGNALGHTEVFDTVA